MRFAGSLSMNVTGVMLGAKVQKPAGERAWLAGMRRQEEMLWRLAELARNVSKIRALGAHIGQWRDG